MVTTAPVPRRGPHDELDPNLPAGVREARKWMAPLDLPPIPEELAKTFKERVKGTFASRPLKGREISPYALFRFLDPKSVSLRSRDFILLGHDGHGVNCHFLHYILIKGPLKIFLQLSWGGAYGDGAGEAVQITKCFSAAADLLKAVERNGRPVEVVASDIFTGWWRIGNGARQKQRDDHHPEVVLRDALAALKQV